MLRMLCPAILLSLSVAVAQSQPPAKPHRDAALKSKDDAGFFSEEAWKKVQPVAEKLLKEKGLDVLFETYTRPKKGDPDKLAAMDPADQEKFFRDFAEERVKAEKIVGLYVVINKNPPALYVERSAAANKKILDETASHVRNALLTGFNNEKFDEGLAESLEIILDSQGLGPKKAGKKKP